MIDNAHLFWTLILISEIFQFFASLFRIEGVFIVGAKRTAFGTFGGTLKNTTATQLQTHACKATLEAAGVRPDQVDTVVIGNVLVVSVESIFSSIGVLPIFE